MSDDKNVHTYWQKWLKRKQRADRDEGLAIAGFHVVDISNFKCLKQLKW